MLTRWLQAHNNGGQIGNPAVLAHKKLIQGLGFKKYGNGKTIHKSEPDLFEWSTWMDEE